MLKNKTCSFLPFKNQVKACHNVVHLQSKNKTWSLTQKRFLVRVQGFYNDYCWRNDFNSCTVKIEDLLQCWWASGTEIVELFGFGLVSRVSRPPRGSLSLAVVAAGPGEEVGSSSGVHTRAWWGTWSGREHCALSTQLPPKHKQTKLTHSGTQRSNVVSARIQNST